MDAGDRDDEVLLAALRSALADSRGAAAARTAADARAAFSFRTMEQELAALVSDSALAPGMAAAGRAATPTRTLVFASRGTSVELEVVDGDIVGQVAPPASGALVLEAADGHRTQVVADELGCFSTSSTGGLLRLHVPTEAGVVVTDWVRVEDTRPGRL